MKNLSIIYKSTLLGIIFFALSLSLSAQGSTDNSKTVKIKTSAICEMCKSKIEKALKNTDGVIESNLNVDTKYATVKYNPAKTDEAKIRTAISKVGYDADNVTANKEAFKKLPGCCKKK